MDKGKLEDSDLAELIRRYRGVKAIERELIDKGKDNPGANSNGMVTEIRKPIATL